MGDCNSFSHTEAVREAAAVASSKNYLKEPRIEGLEPYRLHLKARTLPGMAPARILFSLPLL